VDHSHRGSGANNPDGCTCEALTFIVRGSEKDDPNTQTGLAKIGFFDSDEEGNIYDHETGKLKFKVLEYYK